MNKIRIIGCCASGKSYIARALSDILQIEMYELDNVVYDRSLPNRRHPLQVRDRILEEIVNKDSWIIEGVHYTWTYDTFKKAEIIFIITPSVWQSDWRSIKRFVKTRLGLERSNYKQSLKNLFRMFGWIHDFKREHMSNILTMTEEFKHKRVIVNRNTDILKCLGINKLA